MPSFLNEGFAFEIGAFALSAALTLIYQLYIARRGRGGGRVVFRDEMARLRAAWVMSVMEERRDILAVQTLRNSTMASTFLASTSVLLMIGVMTLSAQGDKLAATWQSLDAAAHAAPQLWMIKILALLTDLFIAFFTFTMSIRLYHHLGYLLNVPLSGKYGAIDPKMVIAQMERAGHFYWLGMRSCYFLAPLALWLFGPQFMLAGTLVLIAVLYRLDHVKSGVDPDSRSVAEG